MILAFCHLPGPVQAATPLEADATISSAVDRKFPFATGGNAGNPGGIVGVAIDGELVFQRAYGMADVAAGITNSTTAPFYLASCSKQFTAMSVLLCQEKGLLATSDEIRLHIPELHPSFDGVKIQHMLNMVSAIYSAGTGNQTNTAAGTLAGLLQEGQYGIITNQLPVGSTMDYCNMNYVLLGIVVERVSGKTLRQFAHDEIFARLGMADTDIRDNLAMVITNQPNGYDDQLKLWSTASSNSPATGSTGVSSTLADLLKWHENFYANELGGTNQSLITLLETPGRYTSGPNAGKPVSEKAIGIPSYACGLIPDISAGNRRVWHTGRWMGFKTAMCRYPDLHISVFILMNQDDQLPSFQGVANIFMTNVVFASNPPLSPAQQGTPYRFKYVATGAPRPVFSLESGGFPDGVILNPDGTLAGTPSTPGDFNGVVKATSGAKTRTQAFTIQVAPAPPVTIMASSLGYGEILPAGTMGVPYGSTVSFTNSPSAWYHVSGVTVDGVNVGAPTVYTLTNVIAGHTIQASFAADTVWSNTPNWWLAEANPVWTNDLSAASTNDQDGDGLSSWQEYIAGTHPTNPASVLDVHVTWSDGQWLVTLPTVETGARHEGLNRYYSLESRTGLVGVGWEPVPGLTDVRGTGQVLIWTNPAGASNRFYRGSVRLAP
jgi:CubicO group peptidase (beta-lactamase class C family)